MYVLAEKDNRHFCGTVFVKPDDPINNLYHNISCDGAIRDQVEITTTFVDKNDKKHGRGACLHVKEVEVFTKIGNFPGKLVDILSYIYLLQCDKVILYARNLMHTSQIIVIHCITITL